MDDLTKEEAFVKGLIELMEKHGVNGLGGDYDGEAYSIYNENFGIYYEDGTEEVLYKYGMTVDLTDLRSFLKGKP